MTSVNFLCGQKIFRQLFVRRENLHQIPLTFRAVGRPFVNFR